MNAVVGGHGGYREGAGRKAADHPDADALESYNAARARHETTKADAAELDLAIKRGQYLAREPIRLAAATAVAAVVQALRSLPDNLEREFHLSPEVTEAIEARVDEALADLGRQFKAMTGE
jgi:phage terminase Nu1 subunit (DNA packaging protein)